MTNRISPFFARATLCVLSFVIGCCLSRICSGNEASGLEPTSKPLPNIVLMMADDMGMGDTSVYQDVTGNADADQIYTPSMERLARSGVCFTDAHSSSSRCTNTRYGLLTGRYAWRSRMKWWVLFGAQGDPLIEADRPTIATLLRGRGYRTGMVGKWHVGLRYRNADGGPAAEFDDADLTKPLMDGPADHGFDFCRFTSRSHGTSGPEPDRISTTKTGKNGRSKPGRNSPQQMVGPGHIDGNRILSSTPNGRRLIEEGDDAYILRNLGKRHSDNAIEFINSHCNSCDHAGVPFFLYYASNSNHSPYTPSEEIGGVAVAGHGRSMAFESMGQRGDFIYENDVALGRLLHHLNVTDDPRWTGHKMIENTMVIFTSDNGAEIAAKRATGPMRSNKGSCYEGGHRVPLIVSWPAGGIDGSQAKGIDRIEDRTPRSVSGELVSLHDLFATFAEITGQDLPAPIAGQKGGEDSNSLLAALRGQPFQPAVVFHNDHKEAKPDAAVSAMRVNDPVVTGNVAQGKWKLFFDPSLLRRGETVPTELYDLATDPMEQTNLIESVKHADLVKHLCRLAGDHRNSGGHRISQALSKPGTKRCDRVRFAISRSAAERKLNDGNELHVVDVADQLSEKPVDGAYCEARGIRMQIRDQPPEPQGETPAVISINPRGMGISSGDVLQFDGGESIAISFDADVIVESIEIAAGNGNCGGWYQISRLGGFGNGQSETRGARMQIYCIDDDIDSKDQSGVLSDVGVLRIGDSVTVSSAAFMGVEATGQWRIGAVTVRRL